MSVPARSNAYGSFTYEEPMDTLLETEFRNGQTDRTLVSGTYVQQKCGRDNHSNNPAQTYRGVPNYRLPSGYYKRYVFEVAPVVGQIKWVNPNPTSDPFSIISQTKTYSASYTGIEGWAMPNEWATPWVIGSQAVYSLGESADFGALLKLRDEKVSLAVSLAEAKEAYDMVVSRTISLIRALIAAKHGRLMDAARLLGLTSVKGIGRAYLEYNYGWKPLMSDIYGGVQLMSEALNKPPLITARHTAKVSTTDAPFGRTEKSLNVDATSTVCLTGQLSDQYKRNCAQAGLSNPLEFAWELIPYSFVVDWVIPVGDFIRAQQAASGLDFFSGWRSFRVNTSGFVPDSGIPADWTVITQPGMQTRGFSFARGAYGAFPSPVLQVKSPFSSKNAWNALALASQLFETKF